MCIRDMPQVFCDLEDVLSRCIEMWQQMLSLVCVDALSRRCIIWEMSFYLGEILSRGCVILGSALSRRFVI